VALFAVNTLDNMISKCKNEGAVEEYQNYRNLVHSFEYHADDVMRPYERLRDIFEKLLFASTYFGPAKPQLPQGWMPDSDLLSRFKDYLHTKDFPFTDAEYSRDTKWLTEQIRKEFYMRAFDKKTADRASFMDDPEVQKAVENMPKAAALLGEAQKVMAARRQ